MPDYHKLEVWLIACEVSDRIDQLVRELGSRIRPHKADQICRAADAIHENIAEGCGFNSDPQLAKYSRQARGSADEVQDQLETFQRRGLILPGFEDLIPKNRVLCRKLSRFIETVDPQPAIRRKRKRQD
jgi:four helix bundle protein